MKKYIEVNLDKMEKGKFNMIASGTGTGKTYFISNELVKRFPANKVLFVTSRSAIAEQQEFSINNKGLDLVAKKISAKDGVNVLNADINTDNNKLNICCYNTLIDILMDNNAEKRLMDSIDVVVFDECHAIEVDTFISNIGTVKTFINDTLTKADRYLIGLSATPQPLMNWLVSIGKDVQFLCKYITNYKAENLFVTDKESLGRIFLDKFENSKAIVLVDKLEKAEELMETLDKLGLNSQFLCSRYRKEFTEEMEKTRNYILETEKLPDDLDVLICTSAYREGINIRDEKVQNVISYYGDFMNLTQFAGRLRQNYRSLVVVNNPMLAVKCDTKAGNYKERCTKDIKLSQYLFNQTYKMGVTSPYWYKGISELVNLPDSKWVIHFHGTINDNKFINYVIDNYLVPTKCDKATMVEKYALTSKRKADLVAKAKEMKIMKGYDSRLNFAQLEKWLSGVGFSIVSQRIHCDGKRSQNKYIIEYIATQKNEGNMITDISEDEIVVDIKSINTVTFDTTEASLELNKEIVNVDTFIDYVRENYLIPKNTDKATMVKDYSLTKEKRDTIVEKAKELDILDCYKSDYSFKKVEKWLIDKGFTIESKKIRCNGTRSQSKYIVNYK